MFTEQSLRRTTEDFVSLAAPKIDFFRSLLGLVGAYSRWPEWYSGVRTFPSRNIPPHDMAGRPATKHGGQAFRPTKRVVRIDRETSPLAGMVFRREDLSQSEYPATRHGGQARNTAGKHSDLHAPHSFLLHHPKPLVLPGHLQKILKSLSKHVHPLS
jgi:hypothetical protein